VDIVMMSVRRSEESAENLQLAARPVRADVRKPARDLIDRSIDLID
jgi:hypothetical protein